LGIFDHDFSFVCIKRKFDVLISKSVANRVEEAADTGLTNLADSMLPVLSSKDAIKIAVLRIPVVLLLIGNSLRFMRCFSWSSGAWAATQPSQYRRQKL
jgi:hypothetical protein